MALPCISFLLAVLQSMWFKFNKVQWTILKIASRQKIHLAFPIEKEDEACKL